VTDTLHITGRLVTAGRIAVCENYSETTYGEDLEIDVVSGILVVMTDDDLRAAAGSMLGKEIEVRLPAASMPACDLDDRASIAAMIERRARECDGFASALMASDRQSIEARNMLKMAAVFRSFSEAVTRGDDRNGGGQ